MDGQAISRRDFLAFSGAGLIGGALYAGMAGAEEPAWVVRVAAADASSVRLLQFTDVHFFNGVIKTPLREERLREKTLEDVKRLIDHARPDVVFVTGDLWHDNPEGRGAEFMAYAVEQCSSWGVPWAFTWGNHDQLDDYDAGHAALSRAPNARYGGATTDGNYVVAVDGADGTRLAEVFCLNTRNTGVDEAACGFVRQTSSALDARGARPMRLGAFHIPVRQYEDVWDNGVARGVIGENVCFEAEDRAALPVLRDAGVQAVFCGHDHVNDYAGVFDGVDLIYGRATGHNGYGSDKVAKGAKLYTLDPARKALEWVSLLPDGSVWKPGAEERTELRRP